MPPSGPPSAPVHWCDPHLTTQLAAGGIDVVTPRPAHGGHEARLWSTAANAIACSFGERDSPEPGNGLKGIRLNLRRTRAPPTADTGDQLVGMRMLVVDPASMQYSKVMQSLRAFMR